MKLEAARLDAESESSLMREAERLDLLDTIARQEQRKQDIQSGKYGGAGGEDTVAFEKAAQSYRDGTLGDRMRAHLDELMAT